MSEVTLPDPEITAETSLAVAQAAHRLATLILDHSTEEVRLEAQREGVQFTTYDDEKQLLGSTTDWDGQFLSFTKLAEKAAVRPDGDITIRIFPSDDDIFTQPGAVFSAGFYARNLLRGRTENGTVIGKGISINPEGTAQVREVVASSEAVTGGRALGWRIATEPEGQAILADLGLIQHKIEAFVTKDQGPVLS